MLTLPSLTVFKCVIERASVFRIKVKEECTRSPRRGSGSFGQVGRNDAELDWAQESVKKERLVGSLVGMPPQSVGCFRDAGVIHLSMGPRTSPINSCPSYIPFITVRFIAQANTFFTDANE